MRAPLCRVVQISKSRNFRKVFSGRYPKLFEHVGQCKSGERLGEVVYEVRFNDSTFRAAGFTRPFQFVRPFGFCRVNDTRGYGIPWKESNRGLVCFNPRQKFSTVPILVGNPTNESGKPCLAYFCKQQDE